VLKHELRSEFYLFNRRRVPANGTVVVTDRLSPR
jgi:hypothetical protein